MFITWTQRWTDEVLGVEGQGHSGLTKHVFGLSIMLGLGLAGGLGLGLGVASLSLKLKQSLKPAVKH